MKICQQCHAEMADNAVFCTKCGAKLEENTTANTAQTENAQQQAAGAQAENAQQAAGAQQTTGGNQNQQNFAPNGGQAYYQPVDIYDHTAEFDAKDVSENKVIAMLVYLMGTVGIILALLASNTSRYAAFHVRQALKFTVIELLLGLVTLLLFWTILVPIAAAIMIFVLWVVRIICFFQICGGKAKEPYIVRNFKFLR